MQLKIKRLKNRYHPETVEVIKSSKAVPWPIEESADELSIDIINLTKPKKEEVDKYKL